MPQPQALALIGFHGLTNRSPTPSAISDDWMESAREYNRTHHVFYDTAQGYMDLAKVLLISNLLIHRNNFSRQMRLARQAYQQGDSSFVEHQSQTRAEFNGLAAIARLFEIYVEPID